MDCRLAREGLLGLDLADGRTVRARSVVVATGARYRRLDARNINELAGAGIWYWASPLEAKLCRGEAVVPWTTRAS